jgi:hypothetical protein
MPGLRRAWPRYFVRAVAALPLIVVFAFGTHATVAAAQITPAAAEVLLYRVFLRDGGMLVSYGEFAQVADRIVLSIPIGGTDDQPVLHLISLAGSDVDWDKTNAYTEAVRAHRYAQTQGEEDFSRLSHEVASMLGQVGQVNDPAKRLALAEAARKQLLEWPQQHYGYRGFEISQMATWLDTVVSEMRIASGQSSFDLAFVAQTPMVAANVPLLPAPTFRERVELGLMAARRTTDSSERIGLLRAVLDTLPATPADADWVAATRASITSELDAEMKADRAYADLTTRALARSEVYARRADVKSLEALIRSVLEHDAQLNRARPAALAALLATLDVKIDAARRLRLARDAWVLRSAVIQEYWRNVRQGLDRLLGLRDWLTDIRQLAGPAPLSVDRLSELAGRAQRELGQVQPPPEVASAHATLRAAAGLAARAAAARLEAIRTGSMDTAWQASSAASGSLMLLDQAIAELRRITRAPGPELPTK